MTCRRQRLVVLGSSVVCVVIGLASCSTPQPMPSVQQLIDRHIVARGGRDNMSAVKTRRLIYRESYPDGKVEEMVTSTKAPNKELVVITEKGGPEIFRTVFDGSHGYALAGGKPIDVPADLLAHLAIDSDIFPELRFDLLFPVAKVVGKETWHGRPVYRVDATSTAGIEERFFFDTESGLRIGIEYPSLPSSHFSEAFEDYLGVKYARSEQVNNNGRTSTQELISIEHNLNLDDTIFK